MRRHIAVLALFPALAFASCASDASSTRSAAPAGAGAQEPSGQGKSGQKSEGKSDGDGLAGLFVPADAEELLLWPEAYKGELLVVSVVPQGTRVEAGRVLVDLDARAIDREVGDAEFDLRAAQAAHESLAGKQALAVEGETAKLERARAGLERSRRALEGWVQHELVFAERGDGISRSRERNWVEDQEDELEQLQLMYNADELTDATEDLVLKRSRRDLELTRERNQLSEDQRAFQGEYQRAKTTAEREEAFAKQALELAHLERTQALAGNERAVALQRSSRELEKKRTRLAELQRDRELFTLRAPSGGVFLHGDPADYRPGTVPAPLEPGSKLSARSVAGFVSGPHPAAVVVDIDAKTAARLEGGAKVTVLAAGRPGASPMPGLLTLEPYPTPSKAGAVYRARIALDGPVETLRTGMPAEVTLGKGPR